MRCQREYILGFIPSSFSVQCCTDAPAAFDCSPHPTPYPPRAHALYMTDWPRQRHESAVGLQSYDSTMQGGSLMTIDWHCTGHAGGGTASACAHGCLSCSSRCAHYSVLCRRQCGGLFLLLSPGMHNDPFYLSNWAITLLKCSMKWMVHHYSTFSFRP